jgi:hypothetical protein
MKSYTDTKTLKWYFLRILRYCIIHAGALHVALQVQVPLSIIQYIILYIIYYIRIIIYYYSLPEHCSCYLHCTVQVATGAGGVIFDFIKHCTAPVPSSSYLYI